MATKRNSVPAETVTECGFCAYVGPTLLGVIQNGTVFDQPKSAIVKGLAPVIAKHPLIEKLIVPGDNLAEAKLNVKRPGNIMYVNYHKLASGKF